MFRHTSNTLNHKKYLDKTIEPILTFVFLRCLGERFRTRSQSQWEQNSSSSSSASSSFGDRTRASGTCTSRTPRRSIPAPTSARLALGTLRLDEMSHCKFTVSEKVTYMLIMYNVCKCILNKNNNNYFLIVLHHLSTYCSN